jgi:putative transposase
VHNLHGTSITPPLEKSELRGLKERFYGSAAIGIMPHLPGRTYSSIKEKGDFDSDATAVLDDNDLAAILISWVVDHYHASPHRGLDGQSPLGKWEELSQKTFIPDPPDLHEIRTALGNPLMRTLTKRGIEVCGNHYSSPELRHYFAHSRIRKMLVRLDPEDIGAVSVEIDGAWFEAKSIHEDLDGVTLDAWVEQHQITLQRFKDVAKLSLDTRREVLAAIRSRRAKAELDRVTPGSQADRPAKIDWLEKNLFHGRSYKPREGFDQLEGQSGPFGTVIQSNHPVAAEKATKKETEITALPSERDANIWRLEDE